MHLVRVNSSVALIHFARDVLRVSCQFLHNFVLFCEAGLFPPNAQAVLFAVKVPAAGSWLQRHNQCIISVYRIQYNHFFFTLRNFFVCLLVDMKKIPSNKKEREEKTCKDYVVYSERERERFRKGGKNEDGKK